MAASSLAAASSTNMETSPLHEAMFYEHLDGKAVRCALCPRRCEVPSGRRGYCRVRENQDGRYVTLAYGRPCTLNLDPVEKKPFFHVYPGSKAFSLATVGCNIHCRFCQNWDISQANPEDIAVAYRTPKDIAASAARSGARTIAFTYSEPTIFYEYMLDCAKAAQAHGIDSIVVSNGFINAAPQQALFPHVKAIKIDLKAFTPSFYKNVCDGELQPVLDTLKRLSASGVWFEIVCLLIPTLNDGADDIRRMAAWIVKELGPAVPLHFSRYQPLYQLRNLPPTPPDTILKARAAAMKEGCLFVYTGNLPGLEGQDTGCPACKAVVIRRYGYQILEMNLEAGKCGRCGRNIPGLWT
jgi:pyruvate formate lyase activating enzyme